MKMKIINSLGLHNLNIPKAYKLFVATNLSTKKKAINLAMKKCYDFVTKELKKVGYNDCFLLQAFSTKLKSENKTN